MSLREDLLLATEPRKELVEIEGIPSFYVRELNVGSVIDMSRVADDDPVGNAVAIVVAGVCDENGNDVFTREDVEALRRRSFRLVNRMMERVLVFNGMSPEQARDEVGKSNGTPTVGSDTSSPDSSPAMSR